MKNQVNQFEERQMSGQGDGGGPGALGSILVIVFGIMTLLCPIMWPAAVLIVAEYERAVVYRFGRIKDSKATGPGMSIVIPCTDTVIKVDKRTISFDIPPQEILTKDSVTIAVDAVVYYKIENAIASVQNCENAAMSTRLLAQTTLRNILGTRSLSGILSERETISNELLQILDEATDPWGIKVERVEVKDVRLPHQLQRAMAAEAEASREAKAKIIAAQGEMNASKSLKEAADVMASSSSALQLRYLQTLSTIAAEKNSTIVFPIPIEMMKGFVKN
jgi:erythrocyte band 7 integral membrane protein